MSHQFIDPKSCQSLAVLVESISLPMLREHAAAVCLEMDIDTWLPLPNDAVGTADLVRILIGQALEEMPQGGDLTITACRTPSGIELEIADTGCDIAERPQRLPMVAASMGARLAWQNCPQGGAAVTIQFPPEAGAQRIAA